MDALTVVTAMTDWHAHLPSTARLRWLAIALALLSSAAAPADEIFAPPPLPAPVEALPRTPRDEVLLISTRSIGLVCDPGKMADGLRCELLEPRSPGGGAWRTAAWNDVLAQLADPLPTVIYVHGNRVESSADKAHGLQFYRALAARKPADVSLRYIIWSWPSSQIRGPVKDYEVKAARTRQVGWQLAWAVDQLPARTPLTLVGYSYGARAVTGTLHLLGGGALGDLSLPERAHPERPPVNALLIAAAVDARWLLPNGYHGRALSQVDSLLLVNNTLDPAMRYYPLSPVGRHATALGHSGIPSRDRRAQIRSYDFTSAVGRHHALSAYLAAAPIGRVLEQAIPAPPEAAGSPAVAATY